MCNQLERTFGDQPSYRAVYEAMMNRILPDAYAADRSLTAPQLVRATFQYFNDCSPRYIDPVYARAARRALGSEFTLVDAYKMAQIETEALQFESWREGYDQETKDAILRQRLAVYNITLAEWDAFVERWHEAFMARTFGETDVNASVALPVEG